MSKGKTTKPRVLKSWSHIQQQHCPNCGKITLHQSSPGFQKQCLNCINKRLKSNK
jgi:ribosomal protein S27E